MRLLCALLVVIQGKPARISGFVGQDRDSYPIPWKLFYLFISITFAFLPPVSSWPTFAAAALIASGRKMSISFRGPDMLMREQLAHDPEIHAV